MGRILLATPPLLAGSVCFGAPTFSTGITTGNLANGSITEASGIVASRMNPNVLWTHNDSGHNPEIFPITPAGANLGTYTISGATDRDWEDIAVGPGPVNGTQYLYIGEIGDNNAAFASVAVYRIAEPTISDTQSPQTVTLSGAVKLNLAYPTGTDPSGNAQGPQDAESLFVDPATSDIYI